MYYLATNTYWLHSAFWRYIFKNVDFVILSTNFIVYTFLYIFCTQETNDFQTSPLIRPWLIDTHSPTLDAGDYPILTSHDNWPTRMRRLISHTPWDHQPNRTRADVGWIRKQTNVHSATRFWLVLCQVFSTHKETNILAAVPYRHEFEVTSDECMVRVPPRLRCIW